MPNWNAVEEACKEAKAIAWDTCHKIYLAMDDEQVDLFREYEYDPLILADDTTPDVLYAYLREWYESSCSLRFIDAVHTNTADPNAGFVDLVPQFDDDEQQLYALIQDDQMIWGGFTTPEEAESKAVAAAVNGARTVNLLSGIDLGEWLVKQY